jgi:hypothetical protein
MTKAKKGLIGCLGCLGLLAVAGVVAALVAIGRSNNQLQAELDLGRKQGIFVENGIREPVPDAENAVVAVKPILTEKVSAALQDFDGSEKWFAENATEFGPVRQKLIDASLKPKFAQTVDYKKRGILAEFAEVADTKNIARFLAADGRRRIGKGDASGIESFRAAARWSVLVRQEPILIATLVGFACEGHLVAEARLALEKQPTSALARQAVGDVIAILSEPHDLKPVIAGEYNYFRLAHASMKDPTIKEELASAEAMFGEDAGPFDPSKVPFLDTVLLSESLRRYRQLHADLPKDPTDLGAVERALDKASDPATGLIAAIDTSGMTLPSISGNVVDVMRKNLARLIVLDSLLAVVESRAVNGQIPATLPLGTLGGEDPFSGTPLMYRVMGPMVRVWSVGPNGTDDSGISSADTDDIGMAITF